jgi:uncharacterized membrane protein SpoIIM required for sporulation
VGEPISTFVADRTERWTDLEELITQAGGSVRRLDPPSVRRLGERYREVVADLAYARRAYPHDALTARLERLAGRARPLVYGTVRERPSVRHFATTGYWQRVRERPLVLLVSGLLLVVPTIATGFWVHTNPTEARSVSRFSEMTAGIGERGPRDPDTQKVTDIGRNVGFSGQIFTNNAMVALRAFAGGLTAGVLTIVSLVLNGFIVGLAAGLVIETGHGEVIWRLLVPHGVLELSLIVAAGAAGLRLGWAMVHPGHRTRGEALVAEARPCLEVAIGCAVLLVPCGIVEGFVTPRGLATPWALAVGFGLGAIYWALVLWRGRPVTAVPTP